MLNKVRRVPQLYKPHLQIPEFNTLLYTGLITLTRKFSLIKMMMIRKEWIGAMIMI